jgi:hypothetical protein
VNFFLCTFLSAPVTSCFLAKYETSYSVEKVIIA